jgi:hypothetical protein
VLPETSQHARLQANAEARDRRPTVGRRAQLQAIAEAHERLLLQTVGPANLSSAMADFWDSPEGRELLRLRGEGAP